MSAILSTVNQPQRRILFVGLCLIALITVFPPSNAFGFTGANEWFDHSLGLSPIFVSSNTWGYRTHIAWDRLGLYWLTIALLTSLGMILAGWLRSEFKSTIEVLKKWGRFLSS